jgi:uncharacterized membrane protein YkoI
VPVPRRSTILLVTLLLLTWAGGSLAQAAGPSRFAQQERSNAAGNGLDARSAAEIARQRSNGKVLSVDRAENGGPPSYRVKVLTPEGRVRVLTIDTGGGR